MWYFPLFLLLGYKYIQLFIQRVQTFYKYHGFTSLTFLFFFERFYIYGCDSSFALSDNVFDSVKIS